jgi:hypothetical protein
MAVAGIFTSMVTTINIGLILLSSLAHSGPTALLLFGIAAAIAVLTFGTALLGLGRRSFE